MGRPMNEDVSIRYEFNQKERADLGAELADIYNQRIKLEEEEKSSKDQFKERRSALDAKVGSLSRQINSGFEMRQTPCTLRWDSPNVGEVSYYNTATGEFIKARPMTVAERQLDLPLQTEEQTKQNVVSFFKKGGEVVEGGKEAPEVTEGSEAPPDAEQPQGEAVAPQQEPQAELPEPPPDWQGSLEEFHAQNGSPEPPEPAPPARGKRPKKSGDKQSEKSVDIPL